jgi:hypothetical protein
MATRSSRLSGDVAVLKLLSGNSTTTTAEPERSGSYAVKDPNVRSVRGVDEAVKDAVKALSTPATPETTRRALKAFAPVERPVVAEPVGDE